MADGHAVRPSRIAGTWYPGSSDALSELLDTLVATAVTPELTARVRGLIVPHAGLRYSGRIAAAAYRAVEPGRVQSVLLLGPAHRGGPALATMVSGGVQTPLGPIVFDEALGTALTSGSEGVEEHAEAHLEEHSLEVQFPFLRRFLPDAAVTPVLMGRQTSETTYAAAEAIVRAVRETGRDVLLVASSDLSHYEARPVARGLDGKVIDHVTRFDPDGLESLLDENPHHACGGGPIVAILRSAARLGARHAAVLDYGDSRTVTTT